MQERRVTLTDPAVVDALAHPVRLDVLGYLMSSGPATASQCARAVGDTPSNCSYHLRVLAALGLVEPDDSGDGRSRPWRATITGFTVESDGPGEVPGTAEMLAASVELDHHLVREYLRGRESVPDEWRRADMHGTYGLALSPAELIEVERQLDAVLRPYLRPTRTDAPDDAEYVHVSINAFPRAEFSGPR
ncbi:helix-turn-helix domain-containing protein [Curtobacterium sp. MCPF17_002]|uniref:winged helix-turn-helix domain-containing protein n=1 Tax=Curtobacterium sp. MCPF17_002 TaxID=2175645 RepID=UPI000DAA726C|nr:helix-turn-helix domain-containing protein [Curtobacterium sp. MCPF17_002]WIB79019.1 helix-turn-helix domain-containing protein [Curtobacterium sp. MCPF17_002]